LKSNVKIGSIYLGKKGAAESHLLLTQQLIDSGCDLKTLITKKNEKMSEYLQLSHKLMLLQLPTNPMGLFKLLMFPRFSGDVLNFMRDRDIVYFYLPHVLDNIVAARLLKNKIYVIRSIHDSKRRSGDYWPTKFSIKRQMKFSSEIIFHSQYVASQVPRSEDFKILPLPTPKRSITSNVGPPYILFIGRFRSYKGIRKLIQAWKILEPKFPKLRLVLAGSGRLPRINLAMRIETLDRWLSPTEIEHLIDGCACVVFPYKEASQSGPLSLAISAHKTAVITNVGGLLEQAKEGSYVLVDYSAESIAKGIEAALEVKISAINETLENRQLANYLLVIPKKQGAIPPS
jgi:glycosyltransferase involved in cell wall biosynthesis